MLHPAPGHDHQHTDRLVLGMMEVLTDLLDSICAMARRESSSPWHTTYDRGWYLEKSIDVRRIFISPV